VSKAKKPRLKRLVPEKPDSQVLTKAELNLLRPSRYGYMMLVIGNNNSWGRGISGKEAYVNCGKPTEWIVYQVYPFVHVDDMGGLTLEYKHFPLDKEWHSLDQTMKFVGRSSGTSHYNDTLNDDLIAEQRIRITQKRRASDG